MVKKISAIMLALLLCLSVVVLPASAAMPDDLTAPTKGMVAYLEWDQESYMPGDDATLNVYVRFDEAIDMLMTGYMVIAFDDNIDTSATSFTPSDLYDSIYKDLNDNYTWMAANLVSKITAKNTAEENALYPNNYLRLSLGKNAGGSHENASNSKLGLPVTEVNELTEAFFSVTVKVSDDAPEGVKLNAAMPSGLARLTTYSTMNYRLNGTTKNVKIAAYDYTAAVAEAAIGAASTPFPTETIVNPLKGQIRFHKNADGTYANAFDVRALAVISGADFNATFGSVEAAEDMIVEAGFVFAAGSNVANPTFDAVKGLVEDGTAADGYTKKPIEFISTSTQPGDYVFSCIVTDATDKTESLVAVGYLAVDTDADGAADDYYYYPSAQTISFTDLFDTHYDKAFPA